MRYCLILTLLYALTTAAPAESVSNDWKTAAVKCGLNPAAIAQLEQNRILITDEAYKQVFSAYIGTGDRPSFITSDSLLNAFHVLLEETVLHIENTNAARLESFLKDMLSDIDKCGPHFKGDQRILESARTRLKLTIGIAVRLQDPSFRIGEKKLDSIIKREAALIEKADGQAMPPPTWLGPPSDDFVGIDYNRYKPRGVYSRTPRLSRYFRALAWLHSIPFRIDQDDELLGMILLQNRPRERRYEDKTDLVDLHWFFGEPDNPDYFSGAVSSSSYIDYERNGLEDERKNALKIYDWGSANEKSCRIISASRLPDDELFMDTIKHGSAQRDLPSGLEIAAALGSAKAHELLNLQGLEDVSQLSRKKRALFPEGVYLHAKNMPVRHGKLPELYHHALTLLLDPAPADAPEFMHGSAWQTKSLNTVLGSWAQMRHTMVLQAKQSVFWMCMVDMPPGFVEPDPEFFEQMNGLALAVREQLENTGAMVADYSQFTDDLKTFVTFAKPFKTEDDMKDAFRKLPKENQVALLQGMNLGYLAATDDFQKQVEWISKLADDIEAGNIDRYPEIKTWFDHPEKALKGKWENMAYISGRLESIAHKQLRNIPLSEADTILIQSYGDALASLMLYDGNSYLNPRDDAPRIVDVFSNLNAGKHLHAGIARARKMYVLYPWEGQILLCTGAVMPYYEFAHPTRLNDAEWKTMLGTSTEKPVQKNLRPAIPEWLEPIVEGGSLGVPELGR